MPTTMSKGSAPAYSDLPPGATVLDSSWTPVPEESPWKPVDEFQYVRLPDGSYGKFAHDATDEQIRGQILKDFPDAYGKPSSPPQTPIARAFGAHTFGDTASSVWSHAKNLVAGPYHAFTDDPRNAEEQQIKGTNDNSGPFENALGEFGLGAARMFVQPTREALRTAGEQAKAGNWAGKNGSGVEYDAQGNYRPNVFGSLMDAMPLVGPWARSIETEARQKGALPALAGLAVDAFAPGGASKLAKTVRGFAPGIAEGALGVSKIDRAYGKTPGRAILDETRGFRPAKIANSAGEKLSQLNAEADRMSSRHIRPVDMTPARDFIDRAIDKAKSQNNAAGVSSLEPVRGQLTANPFELNQPFASPTVGSPNAVISPFQSAEGALNLKRGLRNQFVKNSWNPDAGPMLAKDVARGASGVIGSQLEQALGPGFAKTNQRISSLIPVQDAAESASRNAGLGQRLGGRMKAHTGALTAGAFGAGAGAMSHGIPGAMAGGLVGLLGPEVLGSPTTQMGIARVLNSKLPGFGLKASSLGGVVTPSRRHIP